MVIISSGQRVWLFQRNASSILQSVKCWKISQTSSKAQVLGLHDNINHKIMITSIINCRSKFQRRIVIAKFTFRTLPSNMMNGNIKMNAEIEILKAHFWSVL